jgi:hypothetical protein
MAQPGNSVVKYIRRLTAAGAASTGKVLADFTIFAYHAPGGLTPAAFTHGSTITELSLGWYAWTYTLPSTVGFTGVDIDVASGTDTVDLIQIQDELEAADQDQIASLVNRPIVGISSQGTIGQVQPITLVNKRYRVLRFTFVDADGVAINMATVYGNYAWSVRSFTNQADTDYRVDATNGSPTGFVITGGTGYVDVTIPEDAAFFDLTEGASALDTLDIRHELTGDLGSVATKTVALIPSSPLTLTRREVGTT